MDRNFVLILTLAGAGLLAAVSIGFVLRGPPPEDAVKSPLIEPPVPAARDEAPLPEPGEMPQPRQPRVVPEFEEAPTYTVLQSGLGFYDTKVGKGRQPLRSEYVLVEYTGWLENGTMFDSTYSRDEGFIFPVGMGEAIPGWDQAVESMRVGGKRKVKIPPEMAYGAHGRPPLVPPNAVLSYDMELVGILPPRTAPAAPSPTPDDGWEKREKGLEFYDVKVGDGPEVGPGILVMIDYTGWFRDGTKFDSSLDRARPIVVGLGQGSTMEGWELGIPGMKVGGIRQLRIPAALAFGEEGRDDLVPPNTDFLFEIEVVQARPLDEIPGSAMPPPPKPPVPAKP